MVAKPIAKHKITPFISNRNRTCRYWLGNFLAKTWKTKNIHGNLSKVRKEYYELVGEIGKRCEFCYRIWCSFGGGLLGKSLGSLISCAVIPLTSRVLFARKFEIELGL